MSREIKHPQTYRIIGKALKNAEKSFDELLAAHAQMVRDKAEDGGLTEYEQELYNALTMVITTYVTPLEDSLGVYRKHMFDFEREVRE